MDLNTAFTGRSSTAFSGLRRAQEVLWALELEVLVFGDVGMEPLASGLAFGRFAPVQVAFWGHPITTGLPSIDFFVSSPLFEPMFSEGHMPGFASTKGAAMPRARFSEQIVLMDGPNTAFAKPPAPRASDVEAARSAVIDAANSTDNGPLLACPGGGALVYACLQNPTKLHPDFDAVLVRILAADPCAVVALLRNKKQPLSHRRLVTRLHRAMLKEESARSSEGINATKTALSERLIMVDTLPDSRSYQGLVCSSDVFLDPFPFGGGVTALEALGCPDGRFGRRRPWVVTAPQLQTVHHLAAGMLRHADGQGYVTRRSPHTSSETAQDDGACVRRHAHGSIVCDADAFVAEAVLHAHERGNRQQNGQAAESGCAEDEAAGDDGTDLLWGSKEAVDGWKRLLITAARGATGTLQPGRTTIPRLKA